MRKIFITVGVLIAITLLGNFVYGIQLAQKVDENLKLGIDKGVFPFEFSYTKLRVNPLFSEFTFYNLDVKSKEKEQILQADKLGVNMKYKEALELSQNGKLEKLTFLNLKFDELDLYMGETIAVMEAEKLNLEFDGSLDQFNKETLMAQLPTEKQELYFDVKNLRMSSDFINQDKFKMYAAMYADKEITSGKCRLLFNPDTHHITLNEMEFLTSDYDMEGEFDMEYEGLKIDDFKPKSIAFNSASHSNGTVSIENPMLSGFKYSIDSFENDMSGKFKFGSEDNPMEGMEPEFDIHMDLKGMSFEVPEEQKVQLNAQLSMVGLTTDDLKINEFLVNSHLKDGKLTVEDTRILLPAFKANLLADLNMKFNAPNESEIEAFNLKISDINPGVKNSLQNIEQMLGFTFPMEGDDIVFEVKGSLANPQVKGIHY
ncbi:hypothetical protein [Plebeiibacterium sediminum]|uniref:Uncharacterized protein n=1 Tax=Plebeiibacterium sediminum TaxID=2992112 RepID=A0AAE3M5T6_9BACT|nr:hypothetical protein [Plebeiobacterium sediminum]MCW3787796.1 hypothetical protein [Plebeiobacterium sediminum]